MKLMVLTGVEQNGNVNNDTEDDNYDDVSTEELYKKLKELDKFLDDKKVLNKIGEIYKIGKYCTQAEKRKICGIC